METASIQNSNEIIPAGIPIVTICGFSNSGKTTLIEKLISNCIGNGLRTAVMKHYQRSFQLDTPGKDTYRFFEAGATVFGHDSGQRFIRRHHFEGETVFSDILRLAEDHDLIIIEGHKHISLPGKIWLRRHVNDEPPPEILPVLAELTMTDDRHTIAFDIIRKEVSHQFEKRPMHAGLFIDPSIFEGSYKSGFLKSNLNDLIMSMPKALLPSTEKIHLFTPENTLVDFAAYPIDTEHDHSNNFPAAVKTALNKCPHSQWLMIDVGIATQQLDLLHDLIDLAGPGIWSVLPHRNADIQNPGIIWIDTRAKHLLEISTDFTDLFHHPKTRFLP